MAKKLGFWGKVKADLKARPGRKGNLKDFVVLMLLEPGFQLAFCVRLHEVIRPLPVVGPFASRLLWVASRIWTSCDISPRCVIGPGVFFPHPTGIVMGGGIVVGKNVTIYQGVTLGRLHHDTREQLTVGNHTTIYAGAKVFGNLSVGEHVTIGANAVVLKDVPAHATAVGVPARVLATKNKK